MRVLVLASTFPSAQQPTRGVFVRERVRRLARRCQVVVVAPVPWFPLNRWLRPDRAGIPHREQQGELTVHHPRFLSLPRYGKWLDGVLYFASLVPFLARLRRTFPFEVVDAHFAYPDGLAGVLAGRLFSVPVAVTLRGTEVPLSRFRLRRRQIRLVFRRAHRIIAVSDSLRRLAEELGASAGSVRVIPNGVDRDHFKPGSTTDARRRLQLPLDRPIIVSVGGLTARKGHQRVLAALPALLAKHSELLFIIVGGAGVEGNTGSLLRKQVRELHLEDHVLLAGERSHSEVPLWLQAADLLCLATSNEGRPNAVLEGLACGVPAVVTDVGGNAEIVQDAEDGFVVPFGDTVALESAVRTALTTCWDRRAISARAHRHSWEGTVDQVFGELQALVAGRQGRDAVAAANPVRRMP